MRDHGYIYFAVSMLAPVVGSLVGLIPNLGDSPIGTFSGISWFLFFLCMWIGSI